MLPKAGLCVALLALGSIAALPAAADSWTPKAKLYCEGDQAFIRFGLQDDSNPGAINLLPLAVSRRAWATVAFFPKDRCTLANGDAIVIRSGVGNYFPYGDGGQNPEGFVSLWINGRKALSREQFFPRGGGGTPYLSSILYSAGGIERCQYPEDPPYPVDDGITLVCATTPFDLAKTAVDALEPAEPQTYGVLSIASAYNPDFCRRFVHERGAPGVGFGFLEGGPASQIIGIARSADDIPFPDDWIWPGYNEPDPPGTVRDINGNQVHVATMDFWNTGKPVTVVRLSKWDYGAHQLLYFVWQGDGAANEAQIGALTKTPESRPHSDTFYRDLASANNWRMVPAYDEQGLQEHAVFRHDAVTFVMQWNADPGAATLYKPYGDGRLMRVCTFQRLEPN